MNFQISALGHEQFAPLFRLPNDELANRFAVRCTAATKPGFPCRVSLADAEVGDQLILVNYAHQDAASPYRASHAIFVREGVEQAHPAVDEVPELFRFRILSLRAFDNDGMIVTADLCDGKELAPLLGRQLALRRVAYVHIHYAKFGCYAARADCA
jgi:Protein of unknown function (DUF1203)